MVILVLSDEDKESKKLLLSIAEEPLLGISERYKKMCINPKTGNQCKLRLISEGMISEVNIKTSKARLKLLELTDMGKEKLKESGFDVVSLAVNEKVLESIKTGLGYFNEGEED